MVTRHPLASKNACGTRLRKPHYKGNWRQTMFEPESATALNAAYTVTEKNKRIHRPIGRRIRLLLVSLLILPAYNCVVISVAPIAARKIRLR